ncbi:MAG: sugar ABC transporter substrate-binding protein [Pseudanabaenaceae cyanobacterium bins.68]|nr:sugar ABC transporter substrate-binding protein [Pseudanabaenaceae cyanobacterium bins.68]
MSFTRRRLLQNSLLFSLAACTSQIGTGKSKISFWTMQLKPDFEQYMTDLINQFQVQNPGSEIEWTDVPWSEMENKILTAIAAQTAPDLVNLNPQFASKLASKKVFVDLNQQLDQPTKDLYFPNIWQANQLATLAFGLPWYVTTDVNIYNRQIFTAAGLDPQRPPKTYRELTQVAQQIKAKTSKYAFMLSMDGSQVLESMVQMGMPLLNGAGQAAFNSDQGRFAWQYWVDLYQRKLIPPGTLTDGHRKALELYQAGELAMLLTGPQFLKQVGENAPEIAKVSDVSAQIVGANRQKSAAVMNVALPRGGKNLELALKFALFLTNDQNQLNFAKLGNILPSTKQAATDAYFTNLTDKKAIAAKARIISASQLADAQVLIPPSLNLDQLRQIIYQELQLAMLGKKSVAIALENAAEKWNQSS